MWQTAFAENSHNIISGAMCSSVTLLLPTKKYSLTVLTPLIPGRAL